MMTGFLQDLRFAGRMLVKSPWMSATSAGALAMGVAVTAIMFSIVYAALMRGLPFEDGDRIMRVERTIRGETMSVSIHDYQDWRAQQSSLESISAVYQGTVNVRWTDRPERFDGAFITANGFATLGVQPILGRPFREDEDEPGAPMSLILSHHVWMDRFEGDSEALGQVVKVNGEQAEIGPVGSPQARCAGASPGPGSGTLRVREAPRGCLQGRGHDGVLGHRRPAGPGVPRYERRRRCHHEGLP
jgi:hypothetical protein